jgi:hypothetical protein
MIHANLANQTGVGEQGMNAKSASEEISVAVMDGCTVGWVVSSVNDRAEILDFFDVAAIIEAVVLHDKVELLFPAELRELERKFYDAARDALAPLMQAGVVDFIHFAEPQTTVAGPYQSREQQGSETTLDADNDFVAWFIIQTVKFAVAERTSGGNAIILPRQSAMYKMNRRVKAEHSICNLYLNYKSVRKLVQLARQAASGRPAGLSGISKYWQLPIPPLCLDALGKCSAVDKIWIVTGDLWDEYTSIRRRHHEIAANHGDRESSPAARERQAKKLKQDWTRLISKWEVRMDSFRLADTTNNLRQETGLLGDLGGLGLSVAGDISLDPAALLRSAQSVHRLYERLTGYWRLRKIHDSLESYWKVKDHELYRHFERLLKRPVTSADHEELIKIEAQDRSYPDKAVIADFFPD